MRLLTKNEVTQQMEVERKISIDEGIALARRVDGLRQTAAQEEASLNTFREGTVTEVVDEISNLIAQRDTLISEVNDLEILRNTAMVGVTRREEIVDEKTKQLEQREATLTEREYEISVGWADYQRAVDEQELEKGRISADRNLVAETLIAANVVFGDARSLETRINTHVDEQTAILHKREVNVGRREVEVAARERDMENRITNVEARELAVNLEEKRVQDLYATYQRNLERDGKRK